MLPSLWLKTVYFPLDFVRNLEDFVDVYSVDEEHNNQITFFSNQNGFEEIILDNHFLFLHTNIDFQVVEKEFFQADDKEMFVYAIEHPLIRYRAYFLLEQEASKHTQNNIVGAKVLLTTNPQYHKKDVVTQTQNFLMQNNAKKQAKPVEQIVRYLNFVGSNQDLVKDKQQLYSGLIVKPEHVPQTYFINQSRVSEEQGRGRLDLTEEYKQEMTNILIKDQQASLDSWLGYLNAEYPTWYQTYVLDGLKKMGAYDKQKNRFSRRRKDYVGTFPELNREALAKVYDYLTKYYQGELNLEELDKELLNLLKTGSFARLYEYFLVNTKGIIAWDKETVEGKWVKYEQTDDKEMGRNLAQSLEGYNTGWCTAGVGTAQEQLEEGDFYVYYSKNKLGFETAPRVAIRMEGDSVAEVRGIEPDQNLEAGMTNIMKEKVKELDGGEKYFVKTKHMEKLTNVYNKHKSGEDLSTDELKFLYELDEEIQGFGYDKDPRIIEILDMRNMKEDLGLILNLKEEQIHIGNFYPTTDKELEQIKYVSGQLCVGKNVMSIPDDLVVTELSFDENNKITEIPGTVTIKEYLFLNKNDSIKSLGKGIKVKNILAKNSNLEILPENLIVDNIDVQYCNIKKLPKGLKAEEVKASYSDLKVIEEGVSVKELIVTDTKITSIPHISNLGLLDADNTDLQFLPENFQARDLYIQETPIKELPKNISVKHIYATGSQLEKLPLNLKASYLRISNTHITTLPEGLEVHELDISNSPVKTVSKNIKTTHFYADQSQIKEFPDDFQAEYLYISKTPLKALPNKFKARKIYATKTKLQTLPENLVADQVHLDYSPITSIPASCKVNNLYVNNTLLQKIPDVEDSQINFIIFENTPLAEKYGYAVIKK